MKEFNWDDVKVAYRVAATGSLAKAAEFEGINYTTVLRKINRLEKDLGCKLFFRNQRGYQITEAGTRLLETFPEIESRFNQLPSQLFATSDQVKGTLKITTLPEYSSFLHPILVQAQEQYRELKILVDVSDDIVPLAEGRAHVSIRAGAMPTQADLVALKVSDLNFSYYYSEHYFQLHNAPSCESEFSQHHWVMPGGRKRNLAFVKQVLEAIDENNICYQSNNLLDIQFAVENGLGIGPIDDSKARQCPHLRRLDCIEPHNDSSLWFVYHKDLREDNRIQALIRLGKAYIR
ncbi:MULTISPECIES: LysR family transcriptional regulator [unclassified Pseudoalteromonas]|uniref:LysR family transcriptional regulator n=1 Tax=unclassified Pseudoalteromonas TaxID=194690 RepID=UPI000CF60BAA|nr:MULTISPECIES: LysR family transcriptional regulator [unclassified Pseudoalteromonas]